MLYQQSKLLVCVCMHTSVCMCLGSYAYMHGHHLGATTTACSCTLYDTAIILLLDFRNQYKALLDKLESLNLTELYTCSKHLLLNIPLAIQPPLAGCMAGIGGALRGPLYVLNLLAVVTLSESTYIYTYDLNGTSSTC